jgi:hypothetical protein
LVEVTKRSGRGSFSSLTAYTAKQGVGSAIIFVTLGTLVYDIFQSETDILDKVGNIIADGATIAAGWAGTVGAEAAAIHLFGEAATITVAFFGIIGGVIVSLGTAVIMDKLIEVMKDVLSP